MQNAEFLSFGGDLSPRYFLHHEVWTAGEKRAVTDADAAELDAQFPGCFKFTPVKPQKPAADAPARES